MISHFNYTDRRRIPLQQINFAWLAPVNGILRFQGSINLEIDPPLNPEAAVFVEAYSGSVIMRFNFGTVANICPPDDTALYDFPPGLKPAFRIKVVDESSVERKLLAWAKDIAPLSDEEIQAGRRSILPVETVDLGARVWDLRLEDNSPVLQLNSLIREPRDITSLAKEPDFISLVYPAAIRRILDHLFFGPEHDNVEPDNDWLMFGLSLAGRPAPDRDDFQEDDEGFGDEVEQWVQEVVQGFCVRQAALETYVKFRKEAEERYG